MKIRTFLAIAAMALATPIVGQTPVALPSSTTDDPPKISKRIAKVMAERDGNSCATGYKVRSVGEEYQVLAALQLEPRQQALVSGKKPCDLLTAFDPKTGREREVWFDISAFFGAY